MKIESDPQTPDQSLKDWILVEIVCDPLTRNYILLPPGHSVDSRGATYFVFTPAGMGIVGSLAPQNGIWSKRKVTWDTFRFTAPEKLESLFNFRQEYLPEKAQEWLDNFTRTNKIDVEVDPQNEHEFMEWYANLPSFDASYGTLEECNPYGVHPLDLESLVLLQAKFVRWHENKLTKV